MCTSLALYLGLWSWHAQPAENETHNLVGVQCEALFVGHMKNSYDKDSWIVGVELFHRELTEDWALKGAAGLRSGYKDDEKAASSETQPFVGVGVEYQWTENVAVDFTFGVTVATVGFKLTF